MYHFKKICIISFFVCDISIIRIIGPPTYLKSIGKSKALAATLSNIEPEDDSDNEDDGILNAFTATVNSIDGIVEDVDEEEELVESKFEKMDDQDDIHTAYEKLYKISENMRNFIG